MTEWEKELIDKLTRYSEAEFNYIDTKDITKANEIDYGCSGIYLEGTIIYLEIKNLQYILKESGRRKAAQAYTMLHTVVTSIAEKSGGFVNCFAPNAILVVYPGKDETYKEGVKGAMMIAHALSDTFKHQFSNISGLEFSMGLDHGHIMGSKNLSDNGFDHISWFGSCIYKAMRICKECARPFYIGISGSIYHNLDESFRIAERRILGIKKKVEIWTKVTYQYENVKKHLYQTNHKIWLDEE
jgi:class 3 adenylate cyclase